MSLSIPSFLARTSRVVSLNNNQFFLQYRSFSLDLLVPIPQQNGEEDEDELIGDDDEDDYTESEEEHPAEEALRAIQAEQEEKAAPAAPAAPTLPLANVAPQEDGKVSARSEFDVRGLVQSIVSRAAAQASPAPTPRVGPSDPSDDEEETEAPKEEERPAAATTTAAAEANGSAPSGSSAAPRAMPTLPGRRPMARPGGLPGLPPKRPAQEDARDVQEGASAPAASSSAVTAPSAAAPVAAVPPPPEPLCDVDEKKDTRRRRQELHDLRVQLLRSAMRLGNPQNNIVAQVMYRMDTIETTVMPLKDQALLSGSFTRAGPGSARFMRAKARAEILEAAQPPTNIGMKVTVLCLGWAGAGKTSTINSFLGSNQPTAAFGEGTKGVSMVKGVVKGVEYRFIDTPGLYPAASAKARNQCVLRKAKAAFDKHRPDLVMWFERFDQPRRDTSDLTTLRAVGDIFGPQVWYRSMVCMTHANTEPPEGLRGPIQWDEFQQQRQSMVMQMIKASVGDTRVQAPFSFVENHPNCPKVNDEPVLPSGQAWRIHMAFLLTGLSTTNVADKIIGSKEKAQSPNNQAEIMRMLGMGMGGGYKLPPLPYVLQQLMTPRTPRKAPEDERDIKSEREIESLGEAQRKEETRKRREFIKLKAEEAKMTEEDAGNVAITAPEPPLPPSFDPSETVLHRYRYLESNSGWIVRPILQQQTVDHDDGIDGVALERSLMTRSRGQFLGGVPTFVMAQVQKDKQNMNLQSELEGSWTRENLPLIGGVSLPGVLGFVDRTVNTAAVQVQSLGGQGDYLWTVRNEARVYQAVTEKNKLIFGTMVTSLTDGRPFKKDNAWTIGFKVEDRLKIAKGIKGSLAWGRTAVRSKFAQQSGWQISADVKAKSGPNDRNEVSAQGEWTCLDD